MLHKQTRVFQISKCFFLLYTLLLVLWNLRMRASSDCHINTEVSVACLQLQKTSFQESQMEIPWISDPYF